MNDKHDLTLLSKIAVGQKLFFNDSKYIFKERLASRYMSIMMWDNKLVNEHNKVEIENKYKKVVYNYLYDKDSLKTFNSLEEITEAMLEGLKKTDPEGAILSVLNEKVCGPMYRKFELDHQKWIASPPSTIANEVNDNNILETGTPSDMVRTYNKASVNPIEQFYQSMAAQGLKVDEQKVSAIIKKNETNKSLTIINQSPLDNSETQTDISEAWKSGANSFARIWTSNTDTSSYQKQLFENSLSQKAEQLSSSKKISNSYESDAFDGSRRNEKRNLAMVSSSNDDEQPSPKKLIVDDSFHKASSTQITYAQTLEQLNGSSNDNLFSNAGPISSFTSIKNALSRCEPINQNDSDSELSDVAEMILS